MSAMFAIIGCKSGRSSPKDDASTASLVRTIASSSSMPMGSANGATADALDAVERLALRATPVREFEEKLADVAWAFRPLGTTDCGGDVSVAPPRPRRLDQPTDANEFTRQDKLGRKAALMAGVEGALVVFRSTIRARAGALESSYGRGSVAMSQYDFQSGRYAFVVAADEFSRWPLLGGLSKVAKDVMRLDMKRQVGIAIGSEDVEVRETEEVAHYKNVSSHRLEFAVPSDVARRWSESGVDVDIVSVQRFKGIVYHRVCKRTCLRMFDVVNCGQNDVGFGDQYQTEPVAHRISVGGRIASEELPKAEP